MKQKYMKLMLLLLTIYSFTSCADYLKTESNSTFTEDKVFSNLDFANKAVNGMYADLTSNTFYTYNYLFFKVDNDIEINLSANNASTTSVSHYAADEGNGVTKSVWDLMYKSIERANTIIDNLPNSPIWTNEFSAKAQQLYGETVTLRANCYYELISMWGDVPFKVKSSQSGDNFFLPKTDRDTIYVKLIKELADVEKYVPWMTETRTSQRVNKAFVKGLRAKMALAYAGYSLRNKTFETRRGKNWLEYYKIANQECREVMLSGKHQLNPNFANIFKTLQSYSMDLNYNEVLFEVAFGRLVTGRIAELFGMYFDSSTKYGRGYTNFNVPISYFYSFDRSDLRRNVSTELYYYNSNGVQAISFNAARACPCKWRKSWIIPSMGGSFASSGYTGVNWPMMRYADIVLMYAETENEINGSPTAAAKDALSLIRNRAFAAAAQPSKVKNYVDSVSVSKDAFFNAIVDERAWEFGGELVRKYDLVRWNLLGTKINKMKDDCQKIINDDPKYAQIVPSYLFTKLLADGETLDILNPDYRLPSTAIPGYTINYGWPFASAAAKTSFNLSMSYVANGYNPAKNNHLLPLSSGTISTSNGTLSNDQIP
ncbi:MAG: RagB/SusD family nutrient uptake outer membrane protein [Prolixibacteraceae bacterium]